MTAATVSFHLCVYSPYMHAHMFRARVRVPCPFAACQVVRGRILMGMPVLERRHGAGGHILNGRDTYTKEESSCKKNFVEQW